MVAETHRHTKIHKAGSTRIDSDRLGSTAGGLLQRGSLVQSLPRPTGAIQEHLLDVAEGLDANQVSEEIGSEGKIELRYVEIMSNQFHHLVDLIRSDLIIN